MSLIQIVLAAASLIAACGGGNETALEPQAAEHLEIAGRSAEVRHAPRWSGIEYCDGSAHGESIKNSVEVELGAYEKTRTKVTFAGLDVGPSDEYSCADIALEGLVMMGDKAGAFFDGADAVDCVSSAGHALSAQLVRGHDTDLRYIDPTELPTLSFEVALTETVPKAEGDLGVSTLSKARFNCSFDLELR